MPAPNIQILLAYESAFEPAWTQLLRNQGLISFPEFSGATKQTPFVDVQLTDVEPTTHRHLFRGQMLIDAWTGTIISRVVTERLKNSDRQADMLGKIRFVAQDVVFNEFPSILLPYHYVSLIKEAGLTRGVDLENDLDWSELRHTIHFGVRADAWPIVS